MKIPAGALDGRNVHSLATIVDVNGDVYHGEIATIQQRKSRVNEAGEKVPGFARILFTDGETEFHLTRDQLVDIQLSGWKLTIMDMHREQRELVDRLSASETVDSAHEQDSPQP